jgi:hypothetical protein
LQLSYKFWAGGKAARPILLQALRVVTNPDRCSMGLVCPAWGSENRLYEMLGVGYLCTGVTTCSAGLPLCAEATFVGTQVVTRGLSLRQVFSYSH